MSSKDILYLKSIDCVLTTNDTVKGCKSRGDVIYVSREWLLTKSVNRFCYMSICANIRVLEVIISRLRRSIPLLQMVIHKGIKKIIMVGYKSFIDVPGIMSAYCEHLARS